MMDRGGDTGFACSLRRLKLNEREENFFTRLELEREADMRDRSGQVIAGHLRAFVRLCASCSLSLGPLCLVHDAGEEPMRGSLPDGSLG